MYKGYLSDCRISQGHKHDDYYKTHTSFSAGCYWYTSLLNTDVVDTLYRTSQAIQSESIHGLWQPFLQFSHLFIWNPSFWVILCWCVFLKNKVLIIRQRSCILILYYTLQHVSAVQISHYQVPAG